MGTRSGAKVRLEKMKNASSFNRRLKMSENASWILDLIIKKEVFYLFLIS